MSYICEKYGFCENHINDATVRIVYFVWFGAKKRRVCIIIFVRGCSVLSIPTNITSWTPCIKQHHMEWESLFLGDNYGILELSIQCSRNPSSGRNFTVAISILFSQLFTQMFDSFCHLCSVHTLLHNCL